MNGLNIQYSTTPLSYSTATTTTGNSNIIDNNEQLVFDFKPMFDATATTGTCILQEELPPTHRQQTQQPDIGVKSNGGNLTLTTPYHYLGSSISTVTPFLSEQDFTMNTVDSWPMMPMAASVSTTTTTTIPASVDSNNSVALSLSSMAPPPDASCHITTNWNDIDTIPPARGDTVSLSTLLKHFPDVFKYLGHPQFGIFVNYWYTVQKCITLARFPHHRSVVIRRLYSLFSFELGTLIFSILQSRVEVTCEDLKNEDLEKQTPYIIGAVQTLKERTQAIYHILQKIEEVRVVKGQDKPMSVIVPILQRSVKQRKEIKQQQQQFEEQQLQNQHHLFEQFQSSPRIATQGQERGFNLMNVTTDDCSIENNIAPFIQNQENQQTTYNSNNNNTFAGQQSFFPATSASLTTINTFHQINNDDDDFNICVQPSDLSMQQRFPYQPMPKLSSEISDTIPQQEYRHCQQQQQQQIFEQPSAFTSTSLTPTTTEVSTSFVTPLSTTSPSSYFDSSSCFLPLAVAATSSSVSPPLINTIRQQRLSESKTKNNDIKMESDAEEEKEDIRSGYTSYSMEQEQCVKREESEDNNIYDNTDEYENDDAGDDDDDYFESEYVMESESSEDVMDLIDDDDEDDDYIDGRISSSVHNGRKRGRLNNNTCRRGNKNTKQQTNKKSNASLTINKRSFPTSLQRQQQQRRPRAPRLYTRRTATSYDADTTHYLKSVFFSIYSKRDKLTKEQRKQVQIHTGLKPRNITYWFSNHKRRFQNSLQVFKQAVRESKGKIKSYDDFLEWRRKKGLPEDILESEMVAAEHLFANNNSSNEEEIDNDHNTIASPSCSSSLPSPPPTEDSDNNSSVSTIHIPITLST